MKNKHRNRCMIKGTRLYPEFTAATAPMLSQWTTTEDPCQSGPHTAQANSMGSSSWSKMLSLCSCMPPGFGGHGQGNCNQDREAGHTAPQPNCPEASVHRWHHRHPIPSLQEGGPPEKVRTKSCTKYYVVVSLSCAPQQFKHTSQESLPRWYHPTGMAQFPHQRLQFLPCALFLPNPRADQLLELR